MYETGRVYDTDNQADVDILLGLIPQNVIQYYPRRYEYGTPESIADGLIPVEAVPDVLINPGEYVEHVKESHEKQTMPIYHMYNTWRPKGRRYSQSSLGYCWAFGGVGGVMTTRAMEDKDTILLAPVSMGYLVGWANRGNYLASFIKGAREQGICPAPDGNMNSTNRSASYWNNVNKRHLYKLDKVWDTRSSAMTQHCISILCYGRSLYIAYNWWGHAVELVGIRYVGNTLHWDISNSHNEPDVITLTGSRAIPSEAYGFISTVLAA